MLDFFNRNVCGIVFCFFIVFKILIECCAFEVFQQTKCSVILHREKATPVTFYELHLSIYKLKDAVLQVLSETAFKKKLYLHTCK